MRFVLHVILATTLLAGIPLLGQDAAPKQTSTESSTPAATYKLTFIVRQFAAGKIIESRSYSSLFDSSSPRPGHVRAGSKVPQVQSGGQFTYGDIGVNIDFSSMTRAGLLTARQLAMYVSADVSQAVNGKIDNIDSPIIRQDRWESGFVIELGKPTLLFSSDDPTLDRTTQVELTAVKTP